MIAALIAAMALSNLVSLFIIARRRPLRYVPPPLDEILQETQRLEDMFAVVGEEMGRRLVALEQAAAESERRCGELRDEVRAFAGRWSWPAPAFHPSVPHPLPPLEPIDDPEPTPAERRRSSKR